MTMNKKGLQIVIGLILVLLVTDVILLFNSTNPLPTVTANQINPTPMPTPTPDANSQYVPITTRSPETGHCPIVDDKGYSESNNLPKQLVAATYNGTDITIKVTEAQQVQEMKGIHFRQVARSKGCFTIVELTGINLGNKEAPLQLFGLQDTTGRLYRPTTDNIEISQENISIPPGFSREIKIIFDVPLDAHGLKIVALPEYQTSRQPSEQDFEHGKNSPDSGAGSELVGQTLELPDRLHLKVTGTDRATYLKYYTQNGGAISERGVFLVVIFEMENKGADFASPPSLAVSDSLGRVHYNNNNELDKYHKGYAPVPGVKAGQTGEVYTYFEVPKDATGFKLTAADH